jgi:hypothetical protein
MPISWGTERRPVEIVRSDAAITELGTIWPAIDIRNTQASAITNLAFVIEYLDDKSQKTTTAAVAATAEGYGKSLQVPFSVENVTVWKAPVEPGTTARVDGTFDGVRPLACPEAARITFAMARFKNGTIQQYAAEGWSVPALPRFVPELADSCPVAGENPIQIRAKIQYNAAGDVIGISGPIFTRDDPDKVAWIVAHMKQWKFHPALLDGRPQEGDVDVEFVLYGDPKPDLTGISLTTPAALVVFFPKQAPRIGCFESFGMLQEGTTIP